MSRCCSALLHSDILKAVTDLYCGMSMQCGYGRWYGRWWGEGCVARSTLLLLIHFVPNVSHSLPSAQWAVERAPRVAMPFAERCWKLGVLSSSIPHCVHLCHSHPWSGPVHWAPVQVSGKEMFRSVWGKGAWKAPFTKKSMLSSVP